MAPQIQTCDYHDSQGSAVFGFFFIPFRLLLVYYLLRETSADSAPQWLSLFTPAPIQTPALYLLTCPLLFFS